MEKEDIHSLLAQLTPLQCKVATLFLQGKKIKEIAAELNSNTGNIGNALRRVRARFPHLRLFSRQRKPYNYKKHGKIYELYKSGKTLAEISKMLNINGDIILNSVMTSSIYYKQPYPYRHGPVPHVVPDNIRYIERKRLEAREAKKEYLLQLSNVLHLIPEYKRCIIDDELAGISVAKSAKARNFSGQWVTRVRKEAKALVGEHYGRS